MTVDGDQVPIEAFFSPPVFDHAALSPSGEHMALTAPIDDRYRLVIVETKTLKPLASFRTLRNQEIPDFWWANDERIVFSIAVKRGWLDYPMPTGGLYVLSIDDTKKFRIAADSSYGHSWVYDVLDTYPVDPDRILVVRRPFKRNSIAGSKPVAYLLNVYERPRGTTGTRIGGNRLAHRATSPLTHGHLLSDHDGKVRLAYMSDSDGALQVQYRQTENLKWQPLNSLLTPEQNRLAGPIVLGFGPDNESLYYLTVGDKGTMALAQLELESQRSKILYQHEEFDVTSRDVVLSSNDEEIVGVKFIGDYPIQHYFSSHPQVQVHQDLDKAFPDHLVKLGSQSRDGKFSLASVMSDRTPPTLYLYDHEKQEIRFLMDAYPGIKASDMATRDPFVLKASSGLKLHGYLTVPKGNKRNLPLVVLPHGGPHGVRDTFLFDAEAQFFANRGYAVVQINFRGSAGYGDSFRQAGAREWGGAMIDDIALATQWVTAQGVANRDRVCIYGSSYGAYAALMSVIRYPDLYQCAIGYAGVYDLTIMDRKGDIPFLPDGNAYLKHVLGTDTAKLKRNSPAKRADEIKVPVYIVHGGEDWRAPIQHARKLRKAMEAAGVTYQWMVEEDEGHGFYQKDHRLALYSELLKFLEKHLGSGESRLEL